MYPVLTDGVCSILARIWDRIETSLEAYKIYAEPRYGIDPGMERLSTQFAGSSPGDCLALWEIRKGVNRGVCILGPGPLGDLRDCNALAGPEPAIHHALAYGKRLLYLTTDLDASLRLLGMAEYASMYKLVHVHGDNHHRLHLARGWSSVIYTSQVEAPGALPLGGFTDGDRAVILPMILEAPRIKVLGFTGKPYEWYKDWGAGKPGKVDVAIAIIRHVASELGYSLVQLPEGLELISP